MENIGAFASQIRKGLVLAFVEKSMNLFVLLLR